MTSSYWSDNTSCAKLLLTKRSPTISSTMITAANTPNAAYDTSGYNPAAFNTGNTIAAAVALNMTTINTNTLIFFGILLDHLIIHKKPSVLSFVSFYNEGIFRTMEITNFVVLNQIFATFQLVKPKLL